MAAAFLCGFWPEVTLDGEWVGEEEERDEEGVGGDRDRCRERVDGFDHGFVWLFCGLGQW